MKRAPLLLAFILFLGGCASNALAPATTEPVPVELSNAEAAPDEGYSGWGVPGWWTGLDHLLTPEEQAAGWGVPRLLLLYDPVAPEPAEAPDESEETAGEEGS